MCGAHEWARSCLVTAMKKHHAQYTIHDLSNCISPKSALVIAAIATYHGDSVDYRQYASMNVSTFVSLLCGPPVQLICPNCGTGHAPTQSIHEAIEKGSLWDLENICNANDFLGAQGLHQLRQKGLR